MLLWEFLDQRLAVIIFSLAYWVHGKQPYENVNEPAQSGNV